MTSRGFVVTAAVALLVLSSAIDARATIYVVAKDGSGQFTTVQACANVAVAGDTCSVISGDYDERVTPAYSGTSAASITFNASGQVRLRGFTLSSRSYITVQGFELTNVGFTSDNNPAILATGSTGIRVVGTYIHDTTNICIRSSPFGVKARLALIRGNTITGCGPNTSRVVGIQLYADDSLIEDNDVSHTEDFVRVNGARNVVRGNVWHDSYVVEAPGAHIDGFQSYCTGSPTESASYLLVEDNFLSNVPDENSHLSVLDGGCAVTGTTAIFRFNKIQNLGAIALIAQYGYVHAKFYNNTVNGGQIALSPKGGTVINYTTDAIGGVVRNNILVDAVRESQSPGVYSAIAAGGYNLAFLTRGAITWGNPIVSEMNPVLNKDPHFVSSTDVRLQGDSPARDGGGPLTVVAAGDLGTGTVLVVDDARMFQPGWAGTQGDKIAVGTIDNIAQISAVDYDGNRIMLASSLERHSGELVWLFSNSRGGVVLYGGAPDIGAHEYGSDLPAPANLQIR